MKTKTTIPAAGLVGGRWNTMKQSIQRSVLMALGSMAVGSLLMAQALPAQATYQYTGHNLSNFSASNASYTTSSHLTATLVLAAALPKNQPFGPVHADQLVSLTMNDGVQTLSQSSGSSTKNQKTVISVSTDKDGNISAWDIVESVGNGALLQTTNAGGQKYDVAASTRSIHASAEGYNRDQPGSWVAH
jgi:hypothetical protein